MPDDRLIRDFAALLASADERDDEAFRQIVRAFRLVAGESEFVRAFDLDHWTLRRWSEGQSVPMPALRPAMYRWLHARSQQRLAELAALSLTADSAAPVVAARPAQGLPG
jgi:hypothetical protein